MQIKLTPSDYKAAVDCANMRMFTSNEAGWNNASTYKRSYSERLTQEVIGACGELAFCKAMNWFWSPSVNTFHDIPDVGSSVEVRATNLDTGSLILRDNDDDERWFILVTGEPPLMTIKGRIKGYDGKKDQWLKNPHGHRNSWFVPQSALYSIPQFECKPAGHISC